MLLFVITSCSSSPSSTNDSSLPKYKRSPRRSKSRWEPLPEEKPVDNPVLISNDTIKYSGWLPNEKDRKVFIDLIIYGFLKVWFLYYSCRLFLRVTVVTFLLFSNRSAFSFSIRMTLRIGSVCLN